MRGVVGGVNAQVIMGGKRWELVNIQACAASLFPAAIGVAGQQDAGQSLKEGQPITETCVKQRARAVAYVLPASPEGESTNAGSSANAVLAPK